MEGHTKYPIPYLGIDMYLRGQKPSHDSIVTQFLGEETLGVWDQFAEEGLPPDIIIGDYLDILYPYTDSNYNEDNRSSLQGAYDILLCVVPGSLDEIPDPEALFQEQFAGTYPNYTQDNPRYALLWKIYYNLEENLVTYYYALGVNGKAWQIKMTVPLGQGVQTVRDESNYSAGIFNTNIIQIPESTQMFIPDAPLEVEPFRVVWREQDVLSVSFINTYRHHEDSMRKDPERTVIKTFNEDSTDINLSSGYNCELKYIPADETLYIFGGAGLGKGKPSAIPWDSDSPPQTGIRSINGANNDGVVNIEPAGPGVHISRGDSENKINIRINKQPYDA